MDDPYRMKLGPFLAEFLPCAHEALEVNNGAAMADFDGYLSLIARGQTQFCMYRTLVEAINSSGITPGHRMSLIKDQGADVSGLYPQTITPSPLTPYWESLDLPVYCFLWGEDPFQGDTATLRARANLEEIVNYTARLLARQHRTHLFSVIIVGDTIRLVRITRSFVVVTDPVPLVDNANMVADIFRRYTRLSPVQRGWDATATYIPAGSDMCSEMLAAASRRLEGAADYARQCFASTLTSFWPWWKLAVDDPHTNQTKHFLVAQPYFSQKHLNDRRGSRGYVALAIDEPGKPFVFLKDTWRWEQDGLQSEGATLRRLNAAQVRHIPTLVCEGDVPGQRLDFKDLVKRVYGNLRDDSSAMSIANIVFIHYRVVVREVGKNLQDFKNARQLVEVFRDYIEAHRDAYLLAHTLHRDISPGNMLIVPVDTPDGVKSRGILMDWELSEHIKPTVSRGTIMRRGTYQYLSVKAMDYPKELVFVADELEAFIHVLVGMGMKYLPHDCPDASAWYHAYFDTSPSSGCNTSSECSSIKRRCVEEGALLTSDGKEVLFVLPGNNSQRSPNVVGEQCGRAPAEHPFQKIIDQLLEFASARHAKLSRERDEADMMQGISEAEDDAMVLSTPSASQTLEDASKENEFGGEEPRTPRSKPEANQSPHRVARTPLGDANINSTPALLSDGSEDDDGLGYSSEALDTHLPFISVLDVALSRGDWPRADKTGDQVRRIGDERSEDSYIERPSDWSSGEGKGSSKSESESSFSGDKSNSGSSGSEADSGSSEHGVAEGEPERHDDGATVDDEDQQEQAGEAEPQVTAPPPPPAEDRPGKRARDDDWSRYSSSDIPLAKRAREL